MERFSLGHPALDRAIDKLTEGSPTTAPSAAASLKLLLEGISLSSWREIAWSFSRLTADGFPVEFSFSSVDDAIRYTTEVAGPELSEGLRLDHAIRLLQRVGGERYQLPGDIDTAFHAIQADSSLEYGAWLSARHNSHEQSYKLYIEVPDQAVEVAQKFIRNTLGRTTFLNDCPWQLCMIGYEPVSERTELYFQADGILPWEVAHLLRHFDMCETALFELIEEAYGRSIRRIMPATRVGFSLSMTKSGVVQIFSLFTFARSIFGSDSNIRTSLLKLAFQRGWNLQSYARLSEPLSLEKSWRTKHGMIAFALAHNRPPIVQIGLRPPEEL